MRQRATGNHERRRLAFRLAPAAIVLFAVVAYTPSLEFKYVQDAYHLVKANPVVERGDLVEIFTSDFCKDTASQARSLYRPVTIVSYTLERWIAGAPSPLVSHLFGVVFHVLTALALLLLARRLGVGDGAAAATALLFTVHPLMMQGVVNVAGRADLLVTLFSICSLLCFTWAGAWPRDRGHGAGARRLAAWGAALCLFLALGSKEPAVATPLLLLGMDALYRFPVREGGRDWWIERAAALAPCGLACVVYLVLRTGAIEALWGLPAAPIEDNILAGADGVPHWATVLAILARYVGLLFWPVGMSGDYSGNSIPLEESLLAPLPLAGLGVACLLVVLVVAPLTATLRGRPAARWLSMGAMLFVFPYLVIGNVLALNAAGLAERWLYFPATGFFLVFVAGVRRAAARTTNGDRSVFRLFGDREPGRSPIAARLAGVILLAVALTGIALYTRKASYMWENNLAFFAQCLRATPESLRAYIVLGQRRREDGDLGAALDLYEQAVRRAPGHAPFWIEKGITLWRLGRLDAAETALREAVELRPDLGQAQMYLGLLLARRGKVGEAEPALRKALLYDPYLVRAAEELGDLAFRAGRYNEAAYYYRGCVALGREDLRPKLDAAARKLAEDQER